MKQKQDQGSDFDDARLSHILRYALEEFPIEVRSAILTELKRAKCTSIIAALRQFDLDGTWCWRDDL